MWRNLSGIVIVTVIIAFGYPTFATCRSHGGDLVSCFLVGIVEGDIKWFFFLIGSLLNGFAHSS